MRFVVAYNKDIHVYNRVFALFGNFEQCYHHIPIGNPDVIRPYMYLSPLNEEVYIKFGKTFKF